MNRLANATSPYLQQHKDNPVNWWQWGPEALESAEKTGKPILLSIGYSACHWCHVMAHESFEDESIAALMNDLFVNVKVDREERPDIDQVYMTALHMMGQQGGWPLTMFLHPDGSPFWGATYFPPEPRHGHPGFPDVLRQISALYHSNDDRISSNTQTISNALKAATGTNSSDFPHQARSQLADHLLAAADKTNGGLGQAPKFPNTTILELLWRQGRSGHSDARHHVLHTLERICLGGIYDHVGGGFSRYTVDARWLIPHFEKMLYDNAQLLPLLAYAWAETGRAIFRDRIESTIKWLERDMRLPTGEYAASLDADSEGVEGKYYVWSHDEITNHLGSDSSAFCEAYDVSPPGNWEGVSILNQLHANADTDPALFRRELGKLATLRETRIPPGRDDKIMTDWNALAVTGLSVAAQKLGRDDWLKRAEELYSLISMKPKIPLEHARRDGESVIPAMATDHANLAQAALSLHCITGKQAYRHDVFAHIEQLDRHYLNNSGSGYHLAHSETPDLTYRLLSASDDATPNHNATIATVCATLASLTRDRKWSQKASLILDAFASQSVQAATGHAGLFSASDVLENPIHVTVGGHDSDRANHLVNDLIRLPEPNLVIEMEHSENHDDELSALVCIGTTCSLPLQDPAEIIKAVKTRKIVSSP